VDAPRSRTGLVQQSVQIVASHDLTLFVGLRRDQSNQSNWREAAAMGAMGAMIVAEFIVAR